MKKLIIAFFIVASFSVSAQEAAKDEARSYGVPVAPIPCAGVTNVTEGDVTWNATIVNKTMTAPCAPNQHYIDSLKEAKLLQKEAMDIASGHYNKTTSVHPVVGTNFAANTFGAPSDNSIAVSDSGYIVSVNNGKIAFYKENGTLLSSNYITSWLPFGSINITNPVVLYDTRAGRFIFVCQQYPIEDTGKIYICFSRSYNPAASVGWYCYKLRGNPAGGDGFDFPRIAVNDSELFVTGNLYTSSSSYATFDKPIIHQIDKLAGYAGASMSSIYYPYIVGGTFGMLPVSNGQPVSGTTSGMYLVATNNSGGSTVNLYKITGYLTGSPSITYSFPTVTSYSPPANSHQLGTSGLLNVGDCRILSGFMLNNTIHYVFNCDAGSGYSGISYNRLNVTTSTNTSTVLGLSGTDYAYPSVVSYATTATNPSVIIGFGASGSTIYPEIRAVNCDSAMSWSATTLVKSSASYAGGTSGVTKWGDYSGTSRRHNSLAPSVWMNGGFANASHNWDTWVAEIHDAVSTPCPVPTGLFVNAITVTGATLHWNAVGGALGYNIQYRPVGTGTWLTATSTTTSKALTGLGYSTTYEYQLQTMCSDSSLGAFSSSAADTFRTHNPPIGIQEVNGSAGFRIYPNPVTNIFSVEFTLQDQENVVISVTDIAGKEVKQLYKGSLVAGVNEFSFDKSNLPGGIYILSITTDSKVIKKEKIVIAE